MRGRNRSAWAATLVLWAAAPWAAAATAPASAPAASIERIRADVARLASPRWGGRRAGTRGADHAAEWIASEFRRIGLRPAGEAGSYFQGFSFLDGVVLGHGNRLAIRLPGKPALVAKPTDFRPLSFSGAGEVSGEAVFVGYGISSRDLGRDDYAGVDVHDKVVVVLRYGPGGHDPHSRWAAFTPLRLKVSAARDRGARAVLIVTGPRTETTGDELVPLRAEAALADAGLPAFSVRREVLEAAFAAAGTTLEQAQVHAEHGPAPIVLRGVKVEATADLSPRRSHARNVLGLLGGRQSAETLVIGAHYDHLGMGLGASLDPSPEGKLHAGADDNASGVAGLLELARRLSARSLRRSVLFVAFGAEEQGTLGSLHFVRSPRVAMEHVVAMVNLDMIGRLRDDTLHVHGVGTSPLWPQLLQELGPGSGLELQRREGGYGPSDHSAFYAAGRPVLFFFTGVHSDYHRPSDTADRINTAGIERVVSLVEAVAARVADSPEPVGFTRVAAEKEQPSPARGFRVWVGGIPDYSAEVAGVRFTGITPGSPAETARLQAGDVVVRFGPREIRSVYDYTYALADSKPGDRVPVVIKRGNTELTLEIVLGSRPGSVR